MEGVARSRLLSIWSRNHATVLIVEDHTATRRFLADNLAADGFEPIEAGTATEGRRADASAPARPGHHRPRAARPRRPRAAHARCAPPRAAEAAWTRSCRVLILSGRGSELDRIRGFERGADDYVVKPFSYSELRGRLDALLRRACARPRLGRLRVGALELDPMSRETWVDGAPVHLTNKEFALLRALATEPTRVFTREELLRDVWGFRSIGRDAHAGLARLAPAAQAQRAEATLRGQRVGRRLPAARWGSGW